MMQRPNWQRRDISSHQCVVFLAGTASTHFLPLEPMAMHVHVAFGRYQLNVLYENRKS